jgi:cysteine-S-conjugate beta-lyase
MNIAAPDLPVDPLDVLRKRRSAKWQTYPADVLPLTVAEMDFALAAALTAGEPWLDQLLATLGHHRVRLAGLLRQRLPMLTWDPPEATYLAWLDCTALGPGNEARDLFLERGRVALEPGLRFGAIGGGHARLNFATSGDILDQATARMAMSVT